MTDPPPTPSTPDLARRAFPSERLAVMERYVALLAGEGVLRGLIGPREAPRLWERHVLNCWALSAAVPQESSLADLGSGAGLPGLVLAIGRPDLEVTLVEPLRRRTVFLESVVTELGLDRVSVVRQRAEGLHGVVRFDTVTARALAPLSRLLGWAMPLVARDGHLLAMKGRAASTEIAEAAGVLASLRCAPPEVLDLQAADRTSTATVVRVAHLDAARLG